MFNCINIEYIISEMNLLLVILYLRLDLVSWLIDWCLTPTLAVCQLYRVDSELVIVVKRQISNISTISWREQVTTR